MTVTTRIRHLLQGDQREGEEKEANRRPPHGGATEGREKRRDRGEPTEVLPHGVNTEGSEGKREKKGQR